MIYLLYLQDGPLDGEEFIGLRPYESLHFKNGEVYVAQGEPEWLSDEERGIHLKYQGKMTEEEWNGKT